MSSKLCDRPKPAGWKWLKGEISKRGLMTTEEGLEAAGRAGHSTNRNTFGQYVADLKRLGPREYGVTVEKELCYKLDPPGQKLPALSTAQIDGRVLKELSTAPVSWQTFMTAGWPGADNVGSSGALQVVMSGLRHRHGVGIDGRLYLTLVNSDRPDYKPRPLNEPSAR